MCGLSQCEEGEVVARDNSKLLCHPLASLAEVPSLRLHDEVNRIARGVADEAAVAVAPLVEGQRRVPVVVEGAESLVA